MSREKLAEPVEQMNRLSLRNIRLKFKTSGKLPLILEEFKEYTSK
jgi:hypothetical protein